MTIRGAFRMVLVLLFGLCSACSSFEARWKTAATTPTATRWEGRWTSEKHRTSSGGPEGGRLRAVIEPAAGQKLTAHFRANWLLFASDYSMTLEPKGVGPRRSGGREFLGAHELPKIFGGTYRYEALLAGDRFTARYTSTYDHGSFTLQRVLLSKDCFPAHTRH